MRGNRTGRKGLPRFAPLLYTKAGNLTHFPFYFCDVYHTGKSPVQRPLSAFHFSKYFFLGIIGVCALKISNGGSCLPLRGDPLPPALPCAGVIAGAVRVNGGGDSISGGARALLSAYDLATNTLHPAPLTRAALTLAAIAQLLTPQLWPNTLDTMAGIV